MYIDSKVNEQQIQWRGLETWGLHKEIHAWKDRAK